MASQDPPATKPSPASAEPASPSPAPAPLPARNPLIHYTAWAIAVLGPLALVLPGPRGGSAAKSTLQNAVLGASSFWGVNTLAEDYTGKSITARSGERWGALLGREPGRDGERKGPAADGEDGLPTERAARNRVLMEAERRRRAEAEGRVYKERDRRGLWERPAVSAFKAQWSHNCVLRAFLYRPSNG
ncbi:hypothetical protein BT67DRAFT_432119 [Trichocladium antarcticum]|uniref:Uncharacterized protein n=1 Tax=Trichocladium antarcticum TaxID=1450529 RepID=A0AAN6URP5_9PEZI|nr:hypothetical protein BT67DRAFT_432119 [Trichocladium antarcticum]